MRSRTGRETTAPGRRLWEDTGSAKAARTDGECEILKGNGAARGRGPPRVQCGAKRSPGPRDLDAQKMEIRRAAAGVGGGRAPAAPSGGARILVSGLIYVRQIAGGDKHRRGGQGQTQFRKCIRCADSFFALPACRAGPLRADPLKCKTPAIYTADARAYNSELC